MAQIRTFICFELPENVKRQLSQLQATLKKLGRGVRWVHPDGIHLTLKFLGDVDESKMAEIVNAVRFASTGVDPIQIEISGTGAFPNQRRPRVYWIGVHEASGALFTLQEKIENELARLGFPKENRTFSPHLTLGRVKFEDGLNAISKALENETVQPTMFLADQIIVMQSQLAPNGAVYTPLATIPLKA